MKLKFCGAARVVTGSCHLFELNEKKILVDCGLQQGAGEIDNTILPFNPAEIDAVIVTHAHIDHSGRLPFLVKLGYRGPIYCTRLTAELLGIMLRDSAYIQENDTAWENQKGKRAGRLPKEPLYTIADAESCLLQLRPVDYQNHFAVCEGLRACFQDAGHLLGSAMVELWAKEGETEKKLVFSGDIGNKNQPIIRDPAKLTEADYVVMESTYGTRYHEVETVYTEDLAEIIGQTLAKGGNVVIPAFAVGRTQELLYYIREIKERGLVPELPDFPVYIDSPLAEEATRIFSGNLSGYIDGAAENLVKDGVGMLSFPGLTLCKSVDESKRLNADGLPKVIISASGMCDAGRIRHHLKHNLWRPECTVVFVGYQANGSLGRLLLDGVPRVKLFGEEIAVKAKIVNFPGLSSHADCDGLLEWIQAFQPTPQHVFVVHGDEEVAPLFAEKLNTLGIPAHAPLFTEEYDLLKNEVAQAGFIQKRIKPVPEKVNPAYLRLVEAGNALLALIKRKKNDSSRNLLLFAEQLKALTKKWED